MSLKEKSAAVVASLPLGGQDIKKLPIDLHDDIRKCLDKETQVKLWDGEYKIFHNNGNLGWHGHLNKQGEIHGEYFTYFANGMIRKHEIYKNGQKCGICKQWYSNQQMEHIARYKNGYRLEFKSWYPTGSPENYFECDKYGRLMERKKWYRNGILREHVRFKNGELTEDTQWYDNGNLCFHCFYKTYYRKSQKHGDCKRWDRNGRLISHIRYKNGKVNEVL